MSALELPPAGFEEQQEHPPPAGTEEQQEIPIKLVWRTAVGAHAGWTRVRVTIRSS